jgi:uncharacterized delta-60 repeat protein
MRNYTFLTIVVVLTISTYVFGEAPPAERWVARYNGPGNTYDGARALAIDNAGNVYVTGDSWGSGTSGDYATIKYDPNGNQLWLVRYNGEANMADTAWALKVDNSGNVYVTGQSPGNGTSDDYVTIKYDSAGNQLWLARYNGDANGGDSAIAIVVDNSGSVYVTGESAGSGSASDYVTIKYSPDGNQLWLARYNGPGNNTDGASALAVDNSGNVYVTGQSYSGSGITSTDYATIKYSPDGNQLWVARYNGPANDYDSAVALAVDNAGNVYVTGESWGSGTYDDYATVKYSSDGNQLWVARYNGPRNFYDDATALAVDSAGNAYVTGTSECNGTIYDYATIKYSPDGNQLWLAYYNGPANSSDKAYALAVDNSGNVYVTGLSIGVSAGYDYATVKYNPDGNQLWAVRYNGPGNYDDTSYAIAADNAGNVYVTGLSKGSGTGYDYATIRYTQHDYCIGPIFGDFNNDCKVDFKDFAIFASYWLTCNYALQEDCW